MSATLDNADGPNHADRSADHPAVSEPSSAAAPPTDAPAPEMEFAESDADKKAAHEAAVDAEFSEISLPADRRPRYCRRCQESLSYFNSGPWLCWKCGQEFDPREPRTVLLRRTPLKWKFWFPGFCLATALGMLAYALLISAKAPPLLAVTGAAPVCLGSLLGFGGNTRSRLIGLGLYTFVLWVLLSLALGPSGACAALAMLIPVGIGLVCGLVLRALLENSNWDQRWFFP